MAGPALHQNQVPEGQGPLPAERPLVLEQPQAGLAKLALAALGVVYGDIGTSPLYAIRECFDPSHGIPLTQGNVFGILGLIFWSLMIVVTIKYLSFILQADNRGEGGILALIALLLPKLRDVRVERASGFIIPFGIFGAALLYGDGIITPAISVLSAVEGLQVATPAFQPLVVPATVVILVALFSFQHRGTARVGAVFGPATLLWFLVIGAIGLPWVLRRPEILQAVNPAHTIRFFSENGYRGFLVLGAVVLCITGAEALYADMGHFGKRPIRLGWFALVFPALLLNYFGQGALILERGEDAFHNPFYGLVSGWVLYPLVALATLATVIASQALISGAYSLTQQAIQLGYLPRTRIRHTSRETAGQIYIPQVNQYLMVGAVALVLIFGHSSRLAAAYGVAVTGTMVITSLLYYGVLRRSRRWPRTLAVLLVGAFLIVDLAFFGANLVKLPHGGWIPIVVAGALFTVMVTWKRGREELGAIMLSLAMPLDRFLMIIQRKRPPRVPGTAIFMTLTEDIAPPVLRHHFRHNRVLHERVILMSIVTRNVPQVDESERVQVKELPLGFVKVKARYGFMETPDMSDILIYCLAAGLPLDIDELSFYLGRESFVTSGEGRMPRWRKKLFVLLSRNARPATDYFGIPPDQVIEIGSQVVI
ncbi:MAG: potassium transporter Kup [Oligoflexia bacterium]|nr:potassium transporter Kup [Oligoflexia bacterium]